MKRVALRNDQESFQNTKRLAEFGQAAAQYNLGLMYANGVGVQQDFKLALYWYRQAAEKGVAAAQYILAGKYATGQGVARDQREALSWYLKASDRGNFRATFKLGQMLSVPQEEIANRCFQQAAEKGVVEAQLIVGARSPDTEGGLQQKASKWYRQAAENGVPAAQYILGTRLQSGKGEPQDIPQAIAWYRKSARQGFAAAQSQLGLMYARGDGLSKDSRQAFLWLGRAAEQGDVEAEVNLAMMYEQGFGAPQDSELAKNWYEKAAAQSDLRAQLWLAASYAAEEEYAKALELYRLAAHSGSLEAKYQLGVLYCMDGSGQFSLQNALEWFLSAAKEGDSRSQFALARLIDREAVNISTLLYRNAAEGGEPEAQYILANRLASAEKEVADSSESGFWYGVAAENGVAEAQYIVAQQLLAEGADNQKALALLRKAAKQGYLKAENALGEIYAEGVSVTRDNRQAASWWLKAAEKGDPDALYNLGSLFEKSGGAAADKHAEQWYRRAIERTHDPRPVAALTRLYERLQPPNASEWYQQAALEGDSRAQILLADRLQAACHDSVSREALTWYFHSAVQGESQAFEKLGELSRMFPKEFSDACMGAVDNTIVVPRDLDDGTAETKQQTKSDEEDLFVSEDSVLEAAKNGDVKAQWTIARAHAKQPVHTLQSATEACYWYRLSAQGGFVPAQAELAIMLSSGNGEAQDNEEAAYWWQRAAENGDTESQYNLALMYEKGIGVPQNYRHAAKWFECAARQGVAMAMTRLGLCYATGQVGEADYVEAYAWFATGAVAGNEASQANRDYAASLMSESELKLGQGRAKEIAKDILLKRRVQKEILPN